MNDLIKHHIERYATQLSSQLRARQANNLRGNPEALTGLENTSDLDLLQRFFWKTALLAAAGSFFVLPLATMVIQSMTPPIVPVILWTIIKTCMAASGVLLAIAAYFTFWSPRQTD